MPLLLFAVVFLGGCIVSEEDFNKVVVVRDRLKEDIIRARQENQILNQAILDAYTEREMLVKRVSALEKNLAEFIEPVENDSENSTETNSEVPMVSAAIDQSQPVPSPDPPPAPAEPVEFEKAPNKKKKFYTTSRGDRLSDVARRNAIPLDRLKALNRMKGDPIMPAGKKIRIQ